MLKLCIYNIKVAGNNTFLLGIKLPRFLTVQSSSLIVRPTTLYSNVGHYGDTWKGTYYLYVFFLILSIIW